MKINSKSRAQKRKGIFTAQIAVCFLTFIFALSVSAQGLSVQPKYKNDDFQLVYKNKAADIIVSPEDYKVVNIAANDFASDVKRVSGRKPHIKNGVANLSSNVVIVGTLSKNPLIESLISSGKLDVSGIKGRWESFLIQNVKDPFPNVRNALVIAGSDRRGTAFGVYEMSQKIGVSPWVWWADVAPEKKENLVVSGEKEISGEPSVKYRGIFLNDEDWGLQPWAAKTYEPEIGNIGPKTYAKIFELLLRLKANTCWAAMHEVTKPFNEIPANKEIADDYAIVMGSSHAEPMLRNNVGEWKDDKEKYNFVSNEKGVTEYWGERVKTNGKYENIYTLGMRGIHDSPIQGTKNQAERIPVLEKIISTQRNLLKKYVNENVEEIPQIFCPYKEVLSDYRAGLRVPDDVTVVFPDDNFGYIRYFPNAEEKKRAGGFGVYYHISYLGRPLSYLWLNTAPPALILEEMSKAYESGMRQFWILNVGDIKPAEIGIEFFMQMAWDAKKWNRDNLVEYLQAWAKREFSAKESTETAEIMREYYKLGFQRKPEHLQWYIPKETPKNSDYSAINYGDETQQRLDAYADLKTRAEAIYQKISPDKKDAFYELVLYPVRSAALANERFFAAEKAEIYFKQYRASAKDWALQANAANAEINTDKTYFNEKLAGGKWRNMMSPEMNEGQWTSMRSTLPTVSPAISQMAIPENAKLGVAIEGQVSSVAENQTGTLPRFDAFTKETRFIDVFNQGKANQTWTAQADKNWIKLSQTKGDLGKDTRINVSIDWRKVQIGDDIKGQIEIKTANETRKIQVSAFNPASPRPESLKGFVESNGVISIEAEHFTNNIPVAEAGWQIIKGLGRTGDSVSVFPAVQSSITDRIQTRSPALEYQFYNFTSGEFDANFFMLPTQPLQPGNGLRFAVAVDNQTPQIITVDKDTEVSSPKWAQNVLNQTTIGKSKIKLEKGSHTLKIFMVDAGVVLDKIVLSSGETPPSYLAPPETKIR